MRQKQINLLIAKEEETVAEKRLKKIIPIAAAIFLSIFIIFYIISIIIIQLNIKDHDRVKAEVELMERKISLQKPSESIYLTTINVLKTIQKILNSDTKIIINNLPILFKIQDEDTYLTSSSIDKNGMVGFSVNSYSIDTLQKFVDQLK